MTSQVTRTPRARAAMICSQAFAGGVVAELALETVSFDQMKSEGGGGDLGAGGAALFVGGLAAGGFEDLRIFAVEADIAAAVAGDDGFQLRLRGKEEVADAGTHVDLVGHVPLERLREWPDAGVKGDVYVAGGGELFFCGVTGVVDRGDRVVGHVDDLSDAAVDRGGRSGAEVLFIGLRAARVLAGVDVDVAEAGEDEAVCGVEIAFAKLWAHVRDEAG